MGPAGLNLAHADQATLTWDGDYHTLPAALGCKDWFTVKVATLGELDAALAKAATGESACYIEVVGGRTDFPKGLAVANQHLDAMYGNG